MTKNNPSFSHQNPLLGHQLPQVASFLIPCHMLPHHSSIDSLIVPTTLKNPTNTDSFRSQLDPAIDEDSSYQEGFVEPLYGRPKTARLQESSKSR